MSLEYKILKSYGLSDVIPFGKYKGKEVKDVVSENPQWILWAEDNVKGFTVSHRAFKMAEDNLSEQIEEKYQFLSWSDEYWKE